LSDIYRASVAAEDRHARCEHEYDNEANAPLGYNPAGTPSPQIGDCLAGREAVNFAPAQFTEEAVEPRRMEEVAQETLEFVG
jgi:hypothetical protein